MKRKHKRQLSRIGKAGWAILCAATETYFRAARPGAYVFGGARNSSMSHMQKKGWLELEKEKGEWVGRITEQGILALSEGLEPDKLWQYPWDGKWRMLMFDLPQVCSKERQRLLDWLKDNRFGCLQGSLWVRPRPMDSDFFDHEEIGMEPKQLIAVESTLLGSYSPHHIVEKAWNYEKIGHGYSLYLNALKQWRKKSNPRSYLKHVLVGWVQAAEMDPFLPAAIEPKGYLGRKAWSQRQAFLTNM